MCVCVRIYRFDNFSLPSNNCRMCSTSINSSRCRQYSRPCSRRSNIPHFSRRCNNQRYNKCKAFRLVGLGGKGYEGILGRELCRSGISYLYYNNINSLYFAFLVTSTQLLRMFCTISSIMNYITITSIMNYITISQLLLQSIYSLTILSILLFID